MPQLPQAGDEFAGWPAPLAGRQEIAHDQGAERRRPTAIMVPPGLPPMDALPSARAQPDAAGAADADLDPYPGLAAYPDLDPNLDAYPDLAAYPDLDPNLDAYSERDPYPDLGAYPERDAYPDLDPHPDLGLDPDPATSFDSGSGLGSGSGSGQHRRGGRRISVLLLAAALVIGVGIGLTVGAWARPSGLGSGQRPETGTPAAAGALAPPPLAATATKNLQQALAALNVTVWTTGYLPPASCAFLSAAYARCSHPYPGIGEAVFQNYGSPGALYRAYATAIRQVNNGRFLVNGQDCGSSAPPPGGAEIAWNHYGLHTRAYSIAQLETGRLNAASQAAGRMFCGYNSRTQVEDIIWTETDGSMLGEVTGAPHLAVWSWWLHVHHNIAFSGQPMGGMDMGPGPLPAA